MIFSTTVNKQIGLMETESRPLEELQHEALTLVLVATYHNYVMVI